MSLARREDSLSITDKERIDTICLRFEDAWRTGHRPRLETHLSAVPNRLKAPLFRELLLVELEYRRSLAERPCPEDYQPRFAELVEMIRAAFVETEHRQVRRRFLPGHGIGRYQVRRLLGSGAFASVYLAWDGQLERPVAIKVPHLSQLESATDRHRFLEEARAVAQLKHPGIVALFDVSQLEDGTIYLVMQHIDGLTLRELLDCGPLNFDKAVQIAGQVARAVGAAHRQGVIHRDLKPGNILIDRQGDVHVTDFGLAIRESGQCLRAGECAGTLAYMSPEQLRGESHQLDGRADIWAIGVLLYEMLTERLPFAGNSRDQLVDEILNRDPRPPRQFDSRIPRTVETICLRCLEKRAVDRFATAADVADELAQTARPRRSGKPWFALAATVSLLVLGSLGWRPAWQQLSPWASPSKMCPLSGRIEILTWRPDSPAQQGVPVGNNGVRTLRIGDRVRLDVELDQVGYIYIVWLDSRQQPLPVYPWQNGCWTLRAETETSRLHLSLPDTDDHGWEMQPGPPGMETLVLMARATPLTLDVPLPELLSEVFTQNAGQDLAEATFLLEDHPPSSADTQRGPSLTAEARIEDARLRIQRKLTSRLREHFTLIRTISFFFEGTVLQEVMSRDRSPSADTMPPIVSPMPP